jgi:hypothetical protein
VFARNGAGVWAQQAKLTASDRSLGDSFGRSVAVDGDTALIGADGDGGGRGSAYVFTRSGTTWTQQAKLTASDGTENDSFGEAVALVGDTAMIGAPADDDQGPSSGAVYVFTRSGAAWTEQAKLLASDGGASFGHAVAVAGDTAVIGNPGEDQGNGSAYVFARNDTTWTEQAKLVAPDRLLGDGFGRAVAVDGDTVVIGAFAPGADSFGEAYVFTRSGTAWTLQATLVASTRGQFVDAFGFAVAVVGDTAVIGDPNADQRFGAAYVFARSGTAWAEQAKLVASDGTAEDLFGLAVAVTGDTVVIGAIQDDDHGTDSGSAYVFDLVSPPEDTTPPVLTVSASPTTLRPPNGQLVPVMVSGTITDEPDGSGVSSAAYTVTDEYGQIQPNGTVTPDEADGSYAFTVELQASRRGNDQNGRHYTIKVSATDNAGNVGTESAIVTVPRK